MKQLAPLLTAIALIAALEAQTPAAAPTSAPAPWLPRPVIIIDPRPYLGSPPRLHRATPHPKHRATPHPSVTAAHRSAPKRRRPLAPPTPDTFDRLDTSPSPSPHPRGDQGGGFMFALFRDAPQARRGSATIRAAVQCI